MGSKLTLPIAVTHISSRKDSNYLLGRRSYSATFLPEVAAEEGWDQMTTLKYLVEKAGYNGKLEDVLEKISCERYQSSKILLTYKEYLQMKQQ